MFRLVDFDSAGAFLARARGWLLRAEVENNLILGVAGRLRRRPEPLSDVLLATLEDAGAVRGCAMLTRPYALILSEMPLDALPVLVEHLAGAQLRLPGVLAPAEVARWFGELWGASTGATSRAGIRHRIHRLDELIVAPTVPGTWRRADAADRPLVSAWMGSFAEESGVPGPSDEVLDELIEDGDLVLWVDPAPVSMAAAPRRTPNGAAIAYVYTPPEHRGRHYASAVTAAATAECLRAGAGFCYLFTDRDNPTSNRIYARLGYRPVLDLAELRFETVSEAP